MIYTIVRRHRTKLKWVDALKTADVIPILPWVGSALMVRIGTADRAEIVFRGLGVELIQPENLGAFHETNTSQGNRSHNCSSASTQGAITTARIDDSIRQR